MGWLESLSGGFVALIIASLILISIGFLSDSVRSGKEGEEPKPMSRRTPSALAVGFVVLLGCWVNNLLDTLDGPEPDWFMVVISGLWIVLSILEAFKHGRAAIKGYSAGDIRQ